MSRQWYHQSTKVNENREANHHGCVEFLSAVKAREEEDRRQHELLEEQRKAKQEQIQAQQKVRRRDLPDQISMPQVLAGQEGVFHSILKCCKRACGSSL